VNDEVARSETALLGACLLNKRAPLIAAEYVQATDFYLPSHQLVFAAIQDIVTRGADADPVTVAAQLGPRLADAGGSALIFSLPQACPAATNVREYAATVKEAALDRSIRETVTNALADKTGDALLLALQDQLYKLDRRAERAVSMADVWQRIKANANKPLGKGCEYPWGKIQWLTRGMRPGWLCILAGETSMGKTAGALEIAQYAVRNGKHVVIVSQEMGAEDIGLRIAQKRGLSTDRYYDGRVNGEDDSTLAQLESEDYWANLHIESVEKTAQIGLVFRRWKPDLLVLDHLQLLAGSEEYKELSKTTRQLKLMAEHFQTPILCLSQLSRESGQDKGKGPRLSRLRGSGTIEQDADTVVFMWRKRGEDGELTNESSIIVAKSRMGRLGSIRAQFDGETQTFTEVIGEGWQ
jgi:replicative DNA helicase